VTGEYLSDRYCGRPAHKRKPINLELKIKVLKWPNHNFSFLRIQLSFFKGERKKERKRNILEKL